MGSLSAKAYEEIFSLSTQGLLIIDGATPELAIVHANPAWLTHSGYTLADVQGTGWLTLLALGAQAPELDALHKALADNAACQLSLPYFHEDGALWSAELGLAPLQESDSKRQLWLVQHRSEQRKASADIDASGRFAVGAHSASRLLSRGQFEIHCRRALVAARRESRPLTLMLWTVPELETYRATFGPKTAESCLRMIGTQVTGTFRRSSDVCARFDTATLAVVIAGLSEEQAEQRVTWVEKKVRNLALHNPRGRLSRYLAVRGAAVQVEADESLESLFERADSALAACVEGGPQGLVVPA